MNKNIFVAALLALCLAFASVAQAATCSLAATEYSSAGCSTANLVGCNRYATLNEGDCHAIASPLDGSTSLYVTISNCSTPMYTVHTDSSCTSAATTVTNGCTASAPYFAFAIYADDAASTPYCALGTNKTCRIALQSFNNLACSEYLRCTDNLARGGTGDGVCYYEQRLGLYLLPRCQSGLEELIISNQAGCSGGLTKSFPKTDITQQGRPGTCFAYGSNDTSTFTSPTILFSIYIFLIFFVYFIWSQRSARTSLPTTRAVVDRVLRCSRLGSPSSSPSFSKIS
jgi:hypothetical protein